MSPEIPVRSMNTRNAETIVPMNAKPAPISLYLSFMDAFGEKAGDATPEIIAHNSVFEALAKPLTRRSENGDNTGKKSANASVSGKLAPDAGALAPFKAA